MTAGRRDQDENDHSTLLLVEDDANFPYLIRRYARKSGCRVVHVSLGEKALDLARRVEPVLILLDVALPRMDGWQVLEALRADPDTEDIPVVICSGWDEGLRIWAERGADGYLQKPVSYHDFAETLEYIKVHRSSDGPG